ncbi:hypothetical protein V1512DRAFT_264068 [Lipomyces arxii]|uniref:uncharacterized protein n=1 Tax=Lipomyces arxii TaxID=56418 RepID=UPI0034CDD439
MDNTTDLVKELHILHLIIHRNKNQHHGAKWWKYLSIIHRKLKIVVFSEDSKVTKTKRITQSSQKKISYEFDYENNTVKINAALADLVPYQESKAEIANQIVTKILPKAVNACHRLIAHGQYISLGLVLLASFSRLWALLCNKDINTADKIEETATGADDFGQIIQRDFSDYMKNDDTVEDSIATSMQSTELALYDDDLV